VQFGTITGVVFIGLADVSIASNAVGVSGWSIASHSRTFNKQGGGGTTWEVEQERLFLVMLSVVCMIRFRLINFYKNNVLMG
jgi:hypothetical protein